MCGTSLRNLSKFNRDKTPLINKEGAIWGDYE